MGSLPYYLMLGLSSLNLFYSFLLNRDLKMVEDDEYDEGDEYEYPYFDTVQMKEDASNYKADPAFGSYIDGVMNLTRLFKNSYVATQGNYRGVDSSKVDTAIILNPNKHHWWTTRHLIDRKSGLNLDYEEIIFYSYHIAIIIKIPVCAKLRCSHFSCTLSLSVYT